MTGSPLLEPFGLTWLPLWAQFLLLLLVASLGYALLSWLLPFFVQKGRVEGVRRFLKGTRLPVWIIFAVLIGDWGLRAAFPREVIDPALEATVPVLIILAVMVLVLRITGGFFHLLRKRFDLRAKDNLRARKATTQINLLQRVVTVIIVLISVASALMTIPGVRSYGASLLASAGVAGIVLGFAAQQTLGNVLAGIQIAITQPLRYDDAVVIDGEWGWVEETTLTYIVVRLWDRRRLVVPISQLLQRSFQNWTRSSSSIIGTVYLYLDYRTDLTSLRQVQTAALRETALWDGDVDVVQVVDTTETTMVVRSLVSAKDSPTTWDLRCYLRERLIDHLKAADPDALPRRRLELPRGAESGSAADPERIRE